MSNKFLALFFFLAGYIGEKDLSNQKISAINYSFYSFIYENGDIFEIKNDIKIAYYKDYTLYRTTLLEHEDTTKDNSSIIHIDLNDTTGIRSYQYYVIKNGDQKGLFFSELDKMKPFSYDTLLKYENLDFKNYALFGLDLGKPDKVERDKKTNELTIEKFANKIKGETEPDSLYRYYNKELIPINLSFYPPFDQKAQSKLWKIGLIYNAKPNLPNFTRREIYWKFEKSVIDDSEIFLKFFERFIVEREKMKIK